jgi:hypothetical protein
MDVLRAQAARRSLIAGRVSLALYTAGPTLSRVCGSPHGRAEVSAAVRVRQGVIDLTIEANHCTPGQIKLAEAKIYDGPPYRVNGLSQLLERYSTGREGRGLQSAMFVSRTSKIVAKLRERLDEDLPSLQKGPTRDHT